MPDVSIIVPVYNSERYLPACLQSICSQTWQDIEVICIDDGSSDGSADLLAAAAEQDARIQVVTQENAGVSAARNRGLERATGQYVLFVDSDDLIAPDACEKLVARARRDGADIVAFGGKTFPTLAWADDCFAQGDARYDGDGVIDALFHEPGSFPLMCNKLYASALLRRAQARFDTALRVAEDHEFQFMVYPHARVVSYLPDRLYLYRISPQSAVGGASRDVDGRVSAHVGMVETVVDSWVRSGLAARYRVWLVEWLVRFLAEDLRCCSFDVRHGLAGRVVELLAGWADGCEGELDPKVAEDLAMIRAAARGASDEPCVTFAVSSQFGEAVSADCLRSLFAQTLQDVEYLVQAGSLAPDAAELAARDARCVLVRAADAPDTAGGAAGGAPEATGGVAPDDGACAAAGGFAGVVAARARGGLVVFASGNAVYAPHAAAALGAHARRLAEGPAGVPDAIVFESMSVVLGRRDPWAYVQDDVRFLAGGGPLFSAACFGERMHDALGFVAACKAYAADALSRCLGERGAQDAGETVAALARLDENLETVSFSPDALVGFRAFDFAAADGGAGEDAAAATGVADVAADARAAQAIASLNRIADESSASEALQEFVRFVVGSTRCRARFEAIAAIAPAPVKVPDADEARGCAQDMGDDAYAASLADVAGKLEAEVEALHAEVRATGAWARAADERARRVVQDYESSISYRVGRALTAPARKLRDAKQHVQGRN